MKKICLLGCSGSIGTQTIDIILDHKDEFSLVGISAGTRINIVEDIIFKFSSLRHVCVGLKESADYLKNKYPHLEVYYGDEGLLKLIDNSECDMVVNALVGFVGFVPSVHTIENNIDLALANKESLVVGGELINKLLKHSSSKLYPIDSEHVAIAKCLKGKKKSEIRRIVLTASGGSFRNLSREQLVNVTKEDALKHPSWSMGNKITIDSATMMNKGFEIIEAKHLFNVPLSKIDVLLHDESIIHSMVEFKDYSYLADIGPTDMRVPIAYALFKKNRVEVKVKPMRLEQIGSLHFHEFNEDRYPCVRMAKDALRKGGTYPCCLNAVNEEAVYAFLNDEISFLEIEEIIKLMLDTHINIINPSVDDLISVNNLTRRLTRLEIERRRR